MKKTNLWVVTIEEGDESQVKVMENILNKISEENISNLKKVAYQETNNTRERPRKETTMSHNKNMKCTEKRKDFKIHKD